MRFFIKQAMRRAVTTGCAATFFLAAALPNSAQAQSTRSLPQSTASEPFVVGNDRGGRLSDRLRELVRLRQQGRPVQIQGRICYSTCTMFIGLPDACVSPNTTFGFHGPSSWGRPLDPAMFERASTVIADHYPPSLRAWYLETGRHRINGVYRMTGENLINLGVRSC